VPLDVLHRIGAERRAGSANRHHLDVLLARLATRQAGAVGRPQLVALGLSRREIERLVRSQRLIRVHRGVYAVGHEALSDRGRMIAALLATGRGAAISHETAAHLWSLIPSMPPLVHVTLTGRTPRARPGLVVRRAQHLATTTHHGIPTTTPAQTIAQLSGATHDRARAEALVRGLITSDDDAEPTRSELERALLPALAAAEVPRPRTNAIVLGHEVDFLWPDHRVIVETDGWRYHRHRRAFESDRARDARLVAGGYVVLRFTWRQVIHETLLVVVRIAQVLTRVTDRTGTTGVAEFIPG